MAVKLVVIYPRPTDIDAFEKLYTEEYIPMAVEKLAGKTKAVMTRVLDSPQGTPPFYRIAEIHFPSIEALQSCAASEGGKETLAHAISISSGGSPILLIAEEETFTFS
ncbi:MAG: EthD family reductase [Acidobacteriota bacterium]